VVQALLNQKVTLNIIWLSMFMIDLLTFIMPHFFSEQDLREECIKLKMLVFDLEKQNRALCELFQQKLPNHPTAHYQVTQLALLCDDSFMAYTVISTISLFVHANL